MSKISDKLNIIDNAKNDIKTAIENKGVTVGNVGIQEYASKIDEMEVAKPVTKGIVINEYDNNGYITELTVVGMPVLPTYYFYVSNNSVFSQLIKVNLPNNTTEISSNSFYNNRKLKTINLPDGITKINTSAFYTCEALELTSLPNSITYIAYGAFQKCSNLALTKLPDDITTIESYTFDSCPKLALTELPNGITSILNNGFKGCSNMTLTKLPDALTTIGSYAFNGCTNLTITEVPSGVTNLQSYCFYGCSNITELTVKGNVTQIGTYVFYNCSKLTKLVFPNITSVPSLSSANAFTGSNPISSGTGYIYVPDVLVEDFKTATNWSTYASQIKGVSEL